MNAIIETQVSLLIYKLLPAGAVRIPTKFISRPGARKAYQPVTRCKSGQRQQTKRHNCPDKSVDNETFDDVLS